MELLSHFEARLGQMVEGWSRGPDGTPMPFTVAKFQRGVIPDVVAYATIGLSDHALAGAGRGGSIYQELMIIVRSSSDPHIFPGVLQQLANLALDQRRAYLRGDAIGPWGPIVPGSKMEAFYAAVPVYYDDGFAAVNIDAGKRVAIAWMAPIGRTEAAFVGTAGWRSFESQLIARDPDLLDLSRDEMPLG